MTDRPKIYIVRGYIDYEGHDNLKVFSNKEDAEAFLEKKRSDYNPNQRKMEYADFDIEVKELF